VRFASPARRVMRKPLGRQQNKRMKQSGKKGICAGNFTLGMTAGFLAAAEF
jgi:hypothetical protein